MEKQSIKEICKPFEPVIISEYVKKWLLRRPFQLANYRQETCPFPKWLASCQICEKVFTGIENKKNKCPCSVYKAKEVMKTVRRMLKEYENENRDN